MTNIEQTVKDWLKVGVVPSIPRDRGDEEPSDLGSCVLFRPDAPHPCWKDLQEVESWLSTPEAVPVVGRVVADILNESQSTLESFNREFEARLDESRLPTIDESGLHMPISHLQSVQLSVALESAAAIFHRRAAA